MQENKTLLRELSNETGGHAVNEDTAVNLEDSALDRAMRQKGIEKIDQEIEDRKQDRDQRKKFSKYIFIFMCFYMFISLVIVFFCGFSLMTLSDAVLITLLTTTLANVIGVFNFVAKYLFHK